MSHLDAHNVEKAAFSRSVFCIGILDTFDLRSAPIVAQGESHFLHLIRMCIGSFVEHSTNARDQDKTDRAPASPIHNHVKLHALISVAFVPITKI